VGRERQNAFIASPPSKRRQAGRKRRPGLMRKSGGKTRSAPTVPTVSRSRRRVGDYRGRPAADQVSCYGEQGRGPCSRAAMVCAGVPKTGPRPTFGRRTADRATLKSPRTIKQGSVHSRARGRIATHTAVGPRPDNLPGRGEYATGAPLTGGEQPRNHVARAGAFVPAGRPRPSQPGCRRQSKAQGKHGRAAFGNRWQNAQGGARCSD